MTVVAAARGDHARGGRRRDSAPPAGSAEAIALDVTDRTAASQAVVADLVERTGRLDILVNNAGITRDQLVLRMKREDWDAVLDDEPDRGLCCIAGGAASRWSSSGPGASST